MNAVPVAIEKYVKWGQLIPELPSGLLQLTALEIGPNDSTEVAGALMIDLNGHVPKPPQKFSRQRATVAMSRCPYPPPLLIRLMIECAPLPLTAAEKSAPRAIDSHREEEPGR